MSAKNTPLWKTVSVLGIVVGVVILLGNLFLVFFGNDTRNALKPTGEYGSERTAELPGTLPESPRVITREEFRSFLSSLCAALPDCADEADLQINDPKDPDERKTLEEIGYYNLLISKNCPGAENLPTNYLRSLQVIEECEGHYKFIVSGRNDLSVEDLLWINHISYADHLSTGWGSGRLSVNDVVRIAKQGNSISPPTALGIFLILEQHGLPTQEFVQRMTENGSAHEIQYYLEHEKTCSEGVLVLQFEHRQKFTARPLLCPDVLPPTDSTATLGPPGL